MLVVKIKEMAAQKMREGGRTGDHTKVNIAGRASGAAAADTWTRILMSSLGPVAKQGSLGYALTTSGDTDSWYAETLSALAGQSKIHRVTTLRTRGIHGQGVYEGAVRVEKSTRGKHKQTPGDPTKQLERTRAILSNARGCNAS